MNRPLFVVLAVCLLLSLIATAAIAALNPVRQYYDEAGRIQISGSADGRLLDYLERGPISGNATLGWVVARDTYPTLRMVHQAWEPPRPAPSVAVVERTGGSAEFVIRQLRDAIAWVLFGWWSGEARAVGCTGTGTCFWVSGATGGTISWNTAADWCTTSGGATCGGLPNTTDATTFDSNSVSVATTVQLAATTTVGIVSVTNANVSVSTSGSSFAFNFSGLTLNPGTLVSNGSTITDSGDWLTSGGTFTYSSSTVVLTGTGKTFTPGAVNYPSLTLVSGSSYTTPNPPLINAVLTIGDTGPASLTISGGTFYVLASVTNPILFFPGSTLTGFGNFDIRADVSANIPAMTMSVGSFILFTNGGGTVVTFTGNISQTGNCVVTSNVASITINVSTFAWSCTAALSVGGALSAANGPDTLQVSAGGSVSAATVTIATANAAAVVTSFGSWTVTGNWTNAAGSSAWTFTGSMKFSGSGQVIANGGNTLGQVSLSTAAIQFSQSLVLDNLIANQTCTLTLTAGILVTYRGGSLNGASSPVLTLAASGVWTLNATGQILGAQNVAVQNSNATQGYPVNACLTGTDNGGNSGWYFAGSSFCSPPHGGAPVYAISCSFNPVTVSWICTDSTDYTLFPAVQLVYWGYDGTQVDVTPPDGTTTFRAPGQSWLSPPGNHTVTIMAHGVGDFPPGSFTFYTSELWAWVLAGGILIGTLLAAGSIAYRGRDGNVYFMSWSNVNYRQSAVRVEEYPKGWRSYEQAEPANCVRHRSTQPSKRLKIVWCIRPATAAEQDRMGRRYVAVPQTFRERMS